MKRTWFAVVLALGVGVGRDASAADIVTSVGVPGEPAWDTACGAARNEPVGPWYLFDCEALPSNADCMHRVEIDNGPAGFPRATCNDGTPGTFYIREGSGVDVDNWVIHLEGGAGCDDYESCLDRWCGADGFYTADRMSSDWNADGVSDMPDHVIPPGMPTIIPRNGYATWTHVYVHYCSSDLWMGRVTDVEYTPGIASFDLDMNGHAILYALREMLRKRNDDPAWAAVDGFTVPDLDHADRILFTGTSAGGFGALQNADWFLDPLTGAATALVVDAAMDVHDTVLLNNDVWADLDGNGTGDALYYSHRIETFIDRWAPGGVYEKIDGFVDETCRDAYESMGRLDRCTLPSILLSFNSGGVPMVETPTFVRVDLKDPVLATWYTGNTNPDGDVLLIGGSAGSAITLDDYAVLMRATLVKLYEDHDSVKGVFGPKCGNHIGLENLPNLGADTTPDTDDVSIPPTPIAGTDTTFHDALQAWFDPSGVIIPSRNIDTDEPGVSHSVCQ